MIKLHTPCDIENASQLFLIKVMKLNSSSSQYCASQSAQQRRRCARAVIIFWGITKLSWNWSNLLSVCAIRRMEHRFKCQFQYQFSAANDFELIKISPRRHGFFSTFSADIAPGTEKDENKIDILTNADRKLWSWENWGLDINKQYFSCTARLRLGWSELLSRRSWMQKAKNVWLLNYIISQLKS